MCCRSSDNSSLDAQSLLPCTMKLDGTDMLRLDCLSHPAKHRWSLTGMLKEHFSSQRQYQLSPMSLSHDQWCTAILSYFVPDFDTIGSRISLIFLEANSFERSDVWNLIIIFIHQLSAGGGEITAVHDDHDARTEASHNVCSIIDDWRSLHSHIHRRGSQVSLYVDEKREVISKKYRCLIR